MAGEQGISWLGLVNESDGLQNVTPFGLLNSTSGVAAATAVVWGSVPTIGAVNVQSTDFIVTVDHDNITGTLTITPATSISGGGTFSPTSVSMTTGNITKTFKFTPAKSGSHSISVTNSLSGGGSLTNPSPVTYTVTPAVSITLSHSPSDSTGWPGLSGLKWAWFDATSPGSFSAPTDKGTTGTTDGASVFTVSLPNSTKTNGQTGWLIITDSDGTWAQDPSGKVFSGPVIVT